MGSHEIVVSAIVGAKSFEETARELVPDSVVMPSDDAFTRFLGNPITDGI